MALGLYVVFLALIVGARIAMQYRITGDHGVRFVARDAPPIAKLSTGLLLLAFVATLGIACLDTLGILQPQLRLGAKGETIGAAIALAGTALSVVSQYQMGESWRIGLDDSEKTQLITQGVFSVVRNPIYVGVMMFCVGLLIVAPSIYMLFFILVCYLSIELQVRYVEEPYLYRMHGKDFERYACQVGRFVPTRILCRDTGLTRERNRGG